MELNLHKISCLECRLAELCLPVGLNKEEVSQLTNIVKTKRPIREGELLYQQGGQGNSLFAIRSGTFRSYIADADGAEQTIGFYLPGELVGLDALHNGLFSCSIIALETASVCEVPLSGLSGLASKIPGLQRQLIRIVGKEIASDHEKILLGHRSAKEKMASFLLMLSRRYHALGFSGIEFNLTMRRHDIANFLGLTIETVSRQLSDLTKEGVITVKQRGIQINKLDTLKAIVEPCLSNHKIEKPLPRQVEN